MEIFEVWSLKLDTRQFPSPIIDLDREFREQRVQMRIKRISRSREQNRYPSLEETLKLYGIRSEALARQIPSVDTFSSLFFFLFSFYDYIYRAKTLNARARARAHSGAMPWKRLRHENDTFFAMERYWTTQIARQRWLDKKVFSKRRTFISLPLFCVRFYRSVKITARLTILLCCQRARVCVCVRTQSNLTGGFKRYNVG